AQAAGPGADPGPSAMRLSADRRRGYGGPPMRKPRPSRRAVCLASALCCLVSSAGVGNIGCGPDNSVVWFCLNPATGTLDGAPYDANHFVGGVFDPCHCYDPCGALKSCPISVDAGARRPGACDGGTGGGGGDGGL